MFETVLLAANAKQFLSIAAACCKLSDTVFLECFPSELRLRGISSASNSQFLARFSSTFFATFTYTGSNNSMELALPSRAVVLSLLRLGPLLSIRIFVSVENKVHFVCEPSSHCEHTFCLNVEVTESPKAELPNRKLSFETSSDARVWGCILSAFPSNVKQLRIFPNHSRLCFRSGDANDSSGAFASVDPKTFAKYSLGVSNSHPLVGKCVELRCLRIFSALIDSLQLNIKLGTGDLGVPVLLEGCCDDSSSLSHISLLVAAHDLIEETDDSATYQPTRVASISDLDASVSHSASFVPASTAATSSRGVTPVSAKKRSRVEDDMPSGVRSLVEGSQVDRPIGGEESVAQELFPIDFDRMDSNEWHAGFDQEGNYDEEVDVAVERFLQNSMLVPNIVIGSQS